LDPAEQSVWVLCEKHEKHISFFAEVNYLEKVTENGYAEKQWRRFLLNGGGRRGSRQQGPGIEPLVRGSEEHSPPEAEKKLNFDNTKPL